MQSTVNRWALGLLTVAVLAAQACAVDWDKIGERRVSDRVDHDSIAVTAARGTFTAIKLHVKDNAVRFYKVIVHYRRGPSDELDLRDTIPAGGESRAIDLRGDKRVIRSIEFRYEAKSLGRDGATVTVWGRR
jgi:hypothetical protein